MGQTVFYPGLNEFCRTYLDSNRQVTPAEIGEFPVQLRNQNASIFEQLMLFDKVSFKVYGENILVPYLIGQLGQVGFEALIEQQAVEFVLWTPVVTYLIQDIPGIVALQSGTQSSPAHSDPEASLELGLGWMNPALDKDQRRDLIKKVLPLYKVPGAELSRDAVAITVSAFKSGKLNALDFAAAGKDIQNLSLPDRKALCSCATELLEYSYLISEQMTSFSSYPFFSLFEDSATNLSAKTTLVSDFNLLAELEQFPDLQALYGELGDPFRRLPQMRSRHTATAFRKWLAETTQASSDKSIAKEYIDAIAETKGFFETRSGKMTKAVVMTSIGAGLGGLVGGLEGAVVGGAVGAKALEFAADLGLDLVDEFLISRLTRGWSPKMFFDDLEKFRREAAKHKAC